MSCIFVTLLFVLYSVDCQLVIHSPSSIAKTYISGPLAMLPTDFTVTARLTYIDQELCNDSPSPQTVERLNGTIVLVEPMIGKPDRSCACVASVVIQAR